MPGMVADRDERMRFDIADEKKDREDLLSLANRKETSMPAQACSRMPRLSSFWS